jgi:DNA-binding NarL/FixJ family response regulator
MLRIVIAEDSVLFREGLARLLRESGHEVVDAVGDAPSLLAAVDDQLPDLAIIDVRMPPTMTDDGAQAAHALRTQHPELGILLLSQHVETRHALDMVGTGGFGYLLKDRVLRVDDFLDAVERVAGGGSALDPSVVAALVAPRRLDDRLATLSSRELEVLELAAEGRTNVAIADRLFVTERTVEAHMRSILQKLQIDDSGDSHRRVLAVVAYLGR